MSKDLERLVEKEKAAHAQTRKAKEQFSRPRARSPIARAIRYFKMDKEHRQRSRAARLAFRHR